MTEIRVYNRAQQLLGILDNADAVSYELKHNDLWTGGFFLPTEDPKNALCDMHNLIALTDGARETGLYRIVGAPECDTAHGGMAAYNIEHVMATLLDDILFGYHEIGGAGMPTADVMRYILSKQASPQWVLGECDFSDQFSYKFENTSLLSALMSLGNVLTEEYTWVFDTSARPWKVSLKKADDKPGCGILYRRNLTGIRKSVDASKLVTRLYLLGYGEGVNQLTVRGVNGGKPYIDADTQDKWGVKTSVFTDTRIEDAATLLARGRQLLDKVKTPYVSYSASAIDLSRLTGDDWDTHMPGKLVRVMDAEHGVDFSARIVSVRKDDVGGRPGEIEITIANAPQDAAGGMNALADRVGIGELYSQGATNLYGQQYYDNADAGHPAVLRVYVPSGCVRINEMMLSWRFERFRAYETGAASGGATTSASGGGGTSVAGGGGAWTSDATVPGTLTGSGDAFLTGPEKDLGNGHHAHKVWGHVHPIPSHQHQVLTTDHVHSVRAHTHAIPPHDHPIVYGIFEGGTASTATVKIDGETVPANQVKSSDFNVVPYLQKDKNGKITRGAWHEIEIIPNALTRIEANLFVQTFVQSVGGGDY